MPPAPVDRGALEAAARGIGLGPGERAWRVDVLGSDGRRAGAGDTARAATSLAAEAPAHVVRRIGGHRLLITGAPPLPAAARAAGLHAWPRGGRARHGSSTTHVVVIAAAGAAAGCARLLGARVVIPPGATGGPDTDLPAKAAAALAAIDGGARRVVVHVGAADEAAHERDAAAKVAALERIDAELVAPLARAVREADGSLARLPRPRLRPPHGRARRPPRPVPALAGPERARRPADRADGARAGHGGARHDGGRVIARIVVAGTSSGSGKTTVACGLIGALRRTGRVVQGFKVGPDYIDPSYHALASGRPGRNLDAFLSGPELIAPLVRHGSAGADLAVIEGVMGMFDGASGRGELASTAHVAKLLQAPVVLVVDAGAMARSAAAIVHGYRTFDPEVDVAGVIFNRVGSDHHEELLREATADVGVPVLGALRRDDRVIAPERHLGLVPAAERAAQTRAALDALARGRGPLRRPGRCRAPRPRGPAG